MEFRPASVKTNRKQVEEPRWKRKCPDRPLPNRVRPALGSPFADKVLFFPFLFFSLFLFLFSLFIYLSFMIPVSKVAESMSISFFCFAAVSLGLTSLGGSTRRLCRSWPILRPFLIDRLLLITNRFHSECLSNHWCVAGGGKEEELVVCETRDSCCTPSMEATLRTSAGAHFLATLQSNSRHLRDQLSNTAQLIKRKSLSDIYITP